MRELKLRVITLVVTLLASPLAGADTFRLGLAPADMHPVELMQAPDMPLANESRDGVTFAWPVSADLQLGETHAPYSASSQQFRMEISGSDLTRGIAIVTDAAGAVVRLSPLGAAKGAPRVSDLTVRTPDGLSLRGSQGMEHLVDANDMRAAGMTMRDGSIGFRFKESLGSGRLELHSTLAHKPSERYLLSVLDRNSSTRLNLQSASDIWLAGNRLVANGSLRNKAASVALASAQAWLMSPAGVRYPAAVNVVASDVEITAGSAAPDSPQTGLWELHLATVTADGLRRNAKTAFAVAYPTARYDGGAQVQRSAEGLRIELGAEVASAGRYEARAVVLGTNAAGELRPAMMVSAAAWLESGRGALTLELTTEELEKTGVRAPYALRDLHLLDQSRMALLQRVPGGVDLRKTTK